MRTCHHKTVGNCTGWFHGFFQVGNLEHGCDPVALVEVKSGEVMEVDASGIVFEDALLKDESTKPIPNKKSTPSDSECHACRDMKDIGGVVHGSSVSAFASAILHTALAKWLYASVRHLMVSGEPEYDYCGWCGNKL